MLSYGSDSSALVLEQRCLQVVADQAYPLLVGVLVGAVQHGASTKPKGGRRPSKLPYPSRTHRAYPGGHRISCLDAFLCLLCVPPRLVKVLILSGEAV